MGVTEMLSRWFKRDDRGFTLVELMMVIVILAVLTGVAVPMVGRMQKNAWTAKLTSLADSLGAAVVFEGVTNEIKSDEDWTKFVDMPADVHVVTSLPSGTELKSKEGYLLVALDDAETGISIDGYRGSDPLFTGKAYSWATE